LGFFDRLKQGLDKTRKSFAGRMDQLLSAFVKIDEDLFEEMEEILVTSDIGMETVSKIIAGLKDKIKLRRITDPLQIKNLLQEEITELLKDASGGLKQNTVPSVIVIVGVNGTGKTTSIGKIAANLRQKGKKVIIAAADTFRAAAIEQLEVWADRAGAEVVKQQQGSDAASVVFDAIQAAKSRKADVLICDTAGRLHNKKNLMEELSKILRIIKRELPASDCEVLLVIDAATGQNGVSQAKEFAEAANVTGIILTKLDGTAKGGIVVSIKTELGIPVKFICVGEKVDDMQEFNATEFSKALFEQ